MVSPTVLPADSQAYRELIKYSNFEPYQIGIIQDEGLKISKKKLVFELKRLDGLRFEIIKNFYYLADMLVEAGHDTSKRIYQAVSGLVDRFISQQQSGYMSEDFDWLMIVKRSCLNLEGH